MSWGGQPGQSEDGDARLPARSKPLRSKRPADVVSTGGLSCCPGDGVNAPVGLAWDGQDLEQVVDPTLVDEAGLLELGEVVGDLGGEGDGVERHDGRREEPDRVVGDRKRERGTERVGLLTVDSRAATSDRCFLFAGYCARALRELLGGQRQ